MVLINTLFIQKVEATILHIPDDNFVEAVFAQKSPKEAWRKLGRTLFHKEQYHLAAKAYDKGGDGKMYQVR